MAKGKQAEKNGSENGENVNTVPEGFQQTSAPRGAQTWAHFEDLAELWSEKKKAVKGRLMGRFQKPKLGKNGEPQFAYRIKLLEPSIGWLKSDRDSDAEKVEVARGEILCLDEKSALKCLAPLSMDGGVYDVVIRVSPKIDLDGGGTFYPVEVFHKLVGGNPRQVAPPPAQRQDAPSDDIPF